MAYTLRLAVPADAAQIESIYAHYVLTSTCTAQRDPDPPGTREAWLADHGAQHPVTVAVADDGSIAAWGCLSPYKVRWGYRFTVESSVYVRHDLHRRGLGRLIMADLVERATRLGHHGIIAAVTSEQEPSIRLHAALGFVEVGRMEEVIHKFDRWMGVVYMQLRL
jgi:L-amino acid N-acyltransferase